MWPRSRARYLPITAELKDGRWITVRMLEPTDGELLADFYETIPHEDFRFYCPHALTRDEAMRKAAERADAPDFICVVAVDSEARFAGYGWYAWAGPESSTSGFGICVRRGYQSSGAGQALMQRLIEVAEHVGPPRMGLTVQVANLRAVALYRKMGFTVVREQMRAACWGFPPEPEYYMEWTAP